ncbi:hypothetical protein HAX54_048224, partial [Datura stramonium]|nr:hypothetical protein [Datura stramonium]
GYRQKVKRLPDKAWCSGGIEGDKMFVLGDLYYGGSGCRGYDFRKPGGERDRKEMKEKVSLGF